MIVKGFKHWLAACYCALLLCLPIVGLADSAVTLECSMGYNGSITYARKLPISVQLTNNGADATGVLVVEVTRSTEQFDRYEMPVTVAAGSTVNIAVPVTLTSKQKSYRMQWLVGGVVAAEKEVKPERVIDPSHLVVGALSNDPQVLSYLAITKTADPLNRNEYWDTVALTLDRFPSDLDSMRFFDILAVDGIDMSLLNAQQQAAFDAWLRGGGIVLLGGGSQAHAAFPYFTQYTRITPSKVHKNSDITTELLQEYKIAEAMLGQPVMTVGLDGVPTDAESLSLYTTRVGNGSVVTASFSLSDKPLSAWLGKNVFWQRMLVQDAHSRYQTIVTMRNSGDAPYGANRYVDHSITGIMGVKTGDGMWLPIVLLLLFVGMVGFGSYFILKKMDKRDWMWATVPVLAMGCALLMWALSGMLALQKPIAVSYTVVNIAADGATNSSTAVSIAKAEASRMTVGAEHATVDMNNTAGYYYSSDVSDAAKPAQLRYSYAYGDMETISFMAGPAWSANDFLLKDVPLANCAVSGKCCWNGANLQFMLQNEGDLALGEGVIITDYGFISVPELLPGQSVTVEMKPGNVKLDANGSKIGSDGVLLSETDRMNFSYYEHIAAYTQTTERDLKESNEWEIKRFLMNSNTNTVSWNRAETNFHYFVFSDQLADLRLLIDGQPVTRMAQLGMIDVALQFNPISADGAAHFIKGSFPVFFATPGTAGSAGKPKLGEPLGDNDYQSFPLNNKPCFGFDVSVLPEGWSLGSLDITPSNAYYDYKVNLYNIKTGQWDELKTCTVPQGTVAGKTQIKKPDLSLYVDESEILYARLEQSNPSDQYTDIGRPALTMDGGVK